MIRDLLTIAFTVTDGIGRIEFCQPPANVMTLQFFTEFSLLMEEIRIRKDLRAIIISGKGRHFSSGANLDEMLGLALGKESDHQVFRTEEIQQFLEPNSRSFLLLEEMDSCHRRNPRCLSGICF
jgi:enoyl-CoA hydratase/carnithine racemase